MNKITEEMIEKVCGLYKSEYDDRKEDSSLGGKDWLPGGKAGHKSLAAFKRELKKNGIDLSSGKIRKILITGGLYSSALSRAVAEEYEKNHDVEQIAKALGISKSTVYIYLPYERTAYGLENKTSNARRIDRWRRKTDRKSFDNEKSASFDNLENGEELNRVYLKGKENTR